MKKRKKELVEKLNKSKFIGLEEILMLLDSKKPFTKKGRLSESGENARKTLEVIVEGLVCIGAVTTNGNFQDYLDEIIDSNY